jgi:hypothetical protein
MLHFLFCSFFVIFGGTISYFFVASTFIELLFALLGWLLLANVEGNGLEYAYCKPITR